MEANTREPFSTSDRDPRVYLAGERTLLAWVRTGIALMGFGFVVARFGLFLRELAAARGVGANGREGGASLWVGTALVLLGVWVNVAAAVGHVRFRRRFERGEPFATPAVSTTIVLTAVLAAIGVGMTVYLIVIGLR